MINRIVAFCLMVFIISACNTPPPGKFTDDELAIQDSSWKTMMDGHDRVMPMMSDIYRAAKSVEKAAEESQVESTDFHPRAVEMLAQLEAAEDGMMDWMARISDNPLKDLRENLPDHAAVMAQIDRETTAIQEVEAAMTGSIEKAKALVAEREN